MERIINVSLRRWAERRRARSKRTSGDSKSRPPPWSPLPPLPPWWHQRCPYRARNRIGLEPVHRFPRQTWRAAPESAAPGAYPPSTNMRRRRKLEASVTDLPDPLCKRTRQVTFHILRKTPAQRHLLKAASGMSGRFSHSTASASFGTPPGSGDLSGGRRRPATNKYFMFIRLVA